MQLVSAPAGGTLLGPNADPNFGAVSSTVYQGGVATFAGLTPTKAGFYTIRVFDTFNFIFADFTISVVGRQT